MAKNNNILISLAERHANDIFKGHKRVELRRRSMSITPGTTVWIYVKSPVGSIVGRAKVVAVVAQAPSTLWRKFGRVSGLSKKEFFDYFAGAAQGVALVLEQARRLKESLTLERARAIVSGFQPPQFFIKLGEEHPLLDAMSTGT